MPENVRFVFTGNHSIVRSNKDVHAISFANCVLTKPPRGLLDTFPNVKAFEMYKCTLTKLAKEDLLEYTDLEYIYFIGNRLTYLPGDLLSDFNNLKAISFRTNQLTLIEPHLLDGHNGLKIVDFRENTRYDYLFSEFDDNQVTLDAIKEDLKTKYEQKKSEMKVDFSSDLQTFINHNDLLKDLTVKIDDREFRVHKLIVAARSPTIAEILRTNPDLTDLNLTDISVETFEVVLKFIYNAEVPHGLNEADWEDLFAVAARLRIEKLKNFAAMKLEALMNDENVEKIFRISSKYQQQELTQIAFDEIKRLYPEVEFKDEWIENVEKVIKIVEGYKSKVRAIKAIEDEFQKLLNE